MYKDSYARRQSKDDFAGEFVATARWDYSKDFVFQFVSHYRKEIPFYEFPSKVYSFST